MPRESAKGLLREAQRGPELRPLRRCKAKVIRMAAGSVLVHYVGRTAKWDTWKQLGTGQLQTTVGSLADAASQPRRRSPSVAASASQPQRLSHSFLASATA